MVQLPLVQFPNPNLNLKIFCRYENALEKANYASLVLQPGAGDDAQGEEEEEDEMYAVLARARQVIHFATFAHFQSFPAGNAYWHYVS